MAPPAYPFQSLGIITVTTAGTPVPMSTASLVVRGVTLSALKAKGTANSGANIYVQDAQGKVLFVIPKGTNFVPPLQNPQIAQTIDLSTLWIDADTSGDGLLVTAQL